jgi:hypothetical protein
MMYATEMASGGIIYTYIATFMNTGTGVQETLRLCLRNLRGSMLVLLMGGIFYVRHWDGFMWHDILTKFYDELYRRSGNIKF